MDSLFWAFREFLCYYTDELCVKGRLQDGSTKFFKLICLEFKVHSLTEGKGMVITG
jgi:hypothetical protein